MLTYGRTETSTAKFEKFFGTENKDKNDSPKWRYSPNSEKSIIVDFSSLEMFDPDLADLLIEKPEEIIEAAKSAIKNIALDSNVTNIRFENVSNLYNLAELRSDKIGTYVVTQAFLKKINKMHPSIEIGVFECRGCLRLHEVEQPVGNNIIEPSMCGECGGRSFRLLQEDCKNIDLQNIIVGHPDTSRELIIVLEDDLCSYDDYSFNQFKEIGGILKLFKDEKTGNFKEYLYVNHIKDIEDFYPIDYELEAEEEWPGRNSPEGNAWRNAVLNRDGVCRCCGGDKPKYLEAHHIFSWKDYPDMRFDVNNGVTLCKQCHHKYNSYYGHKGTGIGIVDFLTRFGTASKTIINIEPKYSKNIYGSDDVDDYDGEVN